MLGRILLIVAVMAAILLGIIFQVTVPSEAGPLGILAVFILLYLLALCVLTFLIFSFGKAAEKTINTFIAAKRPIRAPSLTRSYYFASLVALAPVMLIGIHSVGELGLYDAVLVILFVVISCIYIAKRSH